MNLSTYLGETNVLWSAFKHLDSSTLDVSTVLHGDDEHDLTASRARHETIDTAEFSSWLRESRQDAQNGQETQASSLTRVVWIQRDVTDKAVHVSDASLQEIVRRFGLRDALKASFTAYAGAQKVYSPRRGAGTGTVKEYCFGIHPKVTLLWSHDTDSTSIQCVCFAGEKQLKQLRQLTELQWHEPMMMLPLACATVLSTEIDHEQEASKEEVRMVEIRTGYHKWKSRTEPRASGNLGSLSAQMSGTAAKLASVCRKTSVVEHVLAFVGDWVGTGDHQARGSQVNPDVALLKHRVEMHKIDTEFIRQRVDIQLSALFNLIAQNDAIASHSVAKQSKIVAVASQRDSTSMKTLAVVTIFFLPGQVVASILAIPLFNWSAGQSSSTATTTTNNKIVDNRFGYYWAITIPLTVITFVIAGMWLLYERHLQSRRIDALDEPRLLVGDGSEIGALTRQRSMAETM